MKTLRNRKISIVILVLQVLISAGLIGIACYVDFVPTKYVAALVVVSLFLLAYVIVSQMTDKSYIPGRILCGLICLFYIGGGYYCINTYSAVDEVAGHDEKIDKISCIVLKDDPAQSIYDAKEYKYGILSVNDRKNTDKALGELKTVFGQDVQTDRKSVV